MFNIFNYILVGGFAFFILLGAIVQARAFPKIQWWRTRGLIGAAAYIICASYSPYLWDSWLGQYRLIDATDLPLWAAIPIGYAVMQFVSYWWHRALHSSNILWRLFHQMHHSVERLDGWGALYHSPLDVLGFTFAGSFALTVLLGMDPLAAAIVGVLGGILVFFTHSNIYTPYWIGWLIQRPESHAVHHQRGYHADNYGELVIWDQLFGTYNNPRAWHGKAGFYNGASARIGDMLLFREVSEPDDSPERSGNQASNQLMTVLLATGSSATLLLMIQSLMPPLV
ncbi:sterol desaturase family protein [Parasphingorhabdus sp.]|uniref:sterol desaturase family protein n=1 Tax=Parasphingorhabdus sp. TaxID=2709688 RepID=UPI003A9386E6